MGSDGTPVLIRAAASRGASTDVRVEVPAYERRRLEDVGFLTAMTLTLLGNYQQTGHFGGPLAYTPYNVALHLAGPENGGLCYDYRRPKHPFGDKLLLAGGHNIPTLYALWIIMGEAMARRHAATGDDRYRVDPNVAMLSIDCLGFRRGAGALRTLLADAGLAGDPLFAQAGLRGIRSLAGHIPRPPISSTTSTAVRRASASPPRPARPPSGTSWGRGRPRRSWPWRASSR